VCIMPNHYHVHNTALTHHSPPPPTTNRQPRAEPAEDEGAEDPPRTEEAAPRLQIPDTGGGGLWAGAEGGGVVPGDLGHNHTP
jgi:hypothetical protein